jgi:hydroxymethylbilane synthase
VATLRLATRGSPLALRQTELVANALRAAHPDLAVEVVVVTTRGDADTTQSLDSIGGQGIFVTEVEAAVTDGRADAAVHSAKDMTSVMAAHLRIAAVPPRADARDGLVGCRVADLPTGGVVATGSARRRAQLAALRPDLLFTEVRGNMERRVARGEDGSVSAVVVAVAAMERLGWLHRLTDIVDPLLLLPQAGQGAIAVQCRADDEATGHLLAAIDDVGTHRCLTTERAVLAHLGGSCTVPVAAWATVGADDVITVHGLVASGDGRTMVRMTRTGEEPAALGAALAHALLFEGGGLAIEGFAAAAALLEEQR